jgi:hypothetical protein
MHSEDLNRSSFEYRKKKAIWRQYTGRIVKIIEAIIRLLEELIDALLDGKERPVR